MLRFSLPVLFLIVAFNLAAQESSVPANYGEKEIDKSLSLLQENYLRQLYYSNVDNVDELVNGKEYLPYYFKSKYKPLLNSGVKHRSNLILKGRRYNNVWLEYDTYLEELIYSDSLKYIDNKVFMISLNKEPVDGFSFYYFLDSLNFRFFSQVDFPGSEIIDGFYEVVYEGDTKFILRHRSYLLVTEGVDEYIYSPEKYLSVNGPFVRIKSQGAFVDLFGERSDEVKRFMRINKVRFRKAGKNEIAAVLRFYDSLALSGK